MQEEVYKKVLKEVKKPAPILDPRNPPRTFLPIELEEGVKDSEQDSVIKSPIPKKSFKDILIGKFN